MTDISKCGNEECPVKERCYRYTAPVGEYQSWLFINSDKLKKGEECEMFWDNSDRITNLD